MNHRLLLAALCALPAIVYAQPGAYAQSCEMKLGAMGPMSGGAAQWGLAMNSAAELAAAEVNQEGGVKLNGKTCKVVVVPYDSKYTADGAAAGSNALAAQDIHLIIGPVGSPEATGIKPVAARNEQVAWNAAYAKNALEAKYPLMFHIAPGPAAWADAVIKRAMKVFPMKSVALIAPNDQGGTDIANVDAAAYKANGVATTEEYYQRGTTNFAPIVTRVLAAKPDVVDTASSPPGDAGVMVKQLRLAGFTGAIGRLGGPGTDEIIRVAGGLEVLKDFYWFETVPTGDPEVRAIDDEYKKLLGKEPVGGTAVWGRLAGRPHDPEGGVHRRHRRRQGGRRRAAVHAGGGPEHRQGLLGRQEAVRHCPGAGIPFGIGIIKDGKNQGVERQDVKPE